MQLIGLNDMLLYMATTSLNTSITMSSSSVIFSGDCEISDFPGSGVLLDSSVELIVQDKLEVSGSGVHGIHVVQNPCLDSGSIDGITVLDCSPHSLRPYIAQMKELLSFPSLGIISDDLRSMLTEIEYELQKQHPEALLVRSIVIAIHNFLTGVTQRLVKNDDFINLRSIGQHIYKIAQLWQKPR